MRRLMLLRHAKSDWTQGQRDHDRTLAPRGAAAAPTVGTYMAEHELVPDRALVSTARRTRETWELVASAFREKVGVAFDDRLYEANAKALLAAVRETEPTIKALLLVGHNPGMQELAKLLIGAGAASARNRLWEKFPTAGLAVIDIPIDAWEDLQPQSGRLDRFVTPRGLHADAD